jgi:carbon starvation protein
MLFANIFFEEQDGRLIWHAMPLLLGALCVLAIAYRYYSAFLAAKVAALDDSRETPAHRFKDGHNYDPTNKWVLFGHHFAAISGAGPLIGPVLAIQYGYMPGLLWLVIGVCLAGAVQDMLVLAASVRRGGKSLAEIARTELGRPAAIIVSAAILFIVVIALAGLGFVVVKALGGDEVRLAEGTRIVLPSGTELIPFYEEVRAKSSDQRTVYRFPENCRVDYASGSQPTDRSESFIIDSPKSLAIDDQGTVRLPAGCVEQIPGSSWGTFTIVCTIPIALIMGWYITKMRRGGGILAASVFGVVGILAAVIVGNWIPGSALERYFSLTKDQTILALAVYGFIASVLPVWMLLCPRDYLSSFLKIGTIALLVLAVFAANPRLPCPPVNEVFLHGGPTFPGNPQFPGNIFPFVFICIMCGSISGFHSLVSSGTTPKMIDKESHIRTIGYGAMLTEGLVGIVALIAAASLDPKLYYDINVDLNKVPIYQADLNRLYAILGSAERPESRDPLHRTGVDAPQHLRLQEHDLAGVERMVGGEALRGRTGGAVTLAVGMAFILTDALDWTHLPIDAIMKYWYHFAIMFEALFILTTIDAGTRIARFLLQEALGKVYPKFERSDWIPGALLATFLVTAGWALLIKTGSISTIWPMFGIANQLLAVIALALMTTLLINSGRARYAPVTLLPMLFVTATTMTAGAQMVGIQFPVMIQAGQVWTGVMNIALTIFVVTCVGLLLLLSASRWIAVLGGMIPSKETTSA